MNNNATTQPNEYITINKTEKRIPKAVFRTEIETKSSKFVRRGFTRLERKITIPSKTDQFTKHPKTASYVSKACS